MPQSPLSTESLAASSATRHDGSFIYIACPWTPVGGGMFKVCDYLLQSQSLHPAESAARLRPLDSRGGASAVFSLWVLTVALAKILWGRIQGRLAGVHVNMGPRLSLFRKGLIVVTCRALGHPGRAASALPDADFLPEPAGGPAKTHALGVLAGGHGGRDRPRRAPPGHRGPRGAARARGDRDQRRSRGDRAAPQGRARPGEAGAVPGQPVGPEGRDGPAARAGAPGFRPAAAWR